MLQFNDESTTKTPHDLGCATETRSSLVEQQQTEIEQEKLDEKANFLALKGNIIEAAKEATDSICKLAAALRKMRKSRLYERQYGSWENFCRSLQVPGFNRLGERSANKMIAALEVRERLAETGKVSHILEEVMLLPTSVVEVIDKAPLDQQPDIARELIEGDGKPSIKRAKQLAGIEDPIPKMEWLIKEFSRIGEIEKISGGFRVSNKDFPYIDRTYRSREEAWKDWQKNGLKNLQQVADLRRSLAKQEDPPAIPVIAEVIISPNSCFDCAHREIDPDDDEVFHCKSKTFQLGPTEDLGSDCSNWRAGETAYSPVAEFSVSQKPWAKEKVLQTPHATELEAVEQLLFALAGEQARAEAVGDIENAETAASRIAYIGKGLEKLLKPKAEPTVEWYTPPEEIERARDFLGGIDLDPASNEIAQKWIKAGATYFKEDDGLSKPWFGRVWCNPPYGNMTRPFLERAIEFYRSGQLEAAVFLVNRTGAAWYLDLEPEFDAICKVKKRIAFIDENGEQQKSPRYYNDYLYLGEDVEGFRAAYEGIGKISPESPAFLPAAV